MKLLGANATQTHAASSLARVLWWRGGFCAWQSSISYTDICRLLLEHNARLESQRPPIWLVWAFTRARMTLGACWERRFQGTHRNRRPPPGRPGRCGRAREMASHHLPDAAHACSYNGREDAVGMLLDGSSRTLGMTGRRMALDFADARACGVRGSRAVPVTSSEELVTCLERGEIPTLERWVARWRRQPPLHGSDA